MKKYFTLLAFIGISTFSFAQTQPYFGVRAGLSSSTIKGDAANSLNSLVEYTNGAVTTGSHTGFFAGVYAGIPISEAVSVEPGINYTQKGYELKGALDLKGVEFLGLNARAQLNMQYVELPVLLKVNINGFQVFAGPQVSYLAKADLKTTAGVLGFNLLNRTMDATDQFNRWDAAVTGGVGYRFANGFNVSASYDHGLSKIDANKNFDAYNRSFKVGVGFSF
jgi:hypothetical protein